MGSPRSKFLLAGLLVSMVSAGCAAGFSTVPADHWETVPTAARAPIDARNQADLIAARAEQTAASTAVLDARRALAAKVVVRATPTATPAEVEASRAAELAAAEQAKLSVLVRIDAARDAGLRASLAWRERRLDAATAHVEVVLAKREFDRAYLIDRRMNADETYDVPRFRGQLATAQERWYRAEERIADAREAMVRANSQLAAAKEAFARLIRVEDPVLTAVSRTSMQLGGWTQTSEMRRRGLKVEASPTEPCRRSECFRRTSGETSYLVLPRPRNPR